MIEDLINQSTIRSLVRLVKPYVLSNNGSMHDVEDVIQEGLYKFMVKYNTKEFTQEGKIEYYIFIICKNCWLKEIERKKKLNIKGSLLAEEVEENNWALKEKERNEALINIARKNIKLLSKKCQMVFDLRKNDLSSQEIADLLNLKNSQMVKDKYYRCKERLRYLIMQDEDYLELMNDG